MNARQRRQHKRHKLKIANMLADYVLEVLNDIKSGEKDIDKAILEAHEFKQIISECV